MGNVSIFSGNFAKFLKKNLNLNDEVYILSGSVDPSSVATSAPAGSLYLNSSAGALYMKTDAGLSTNWSQASTGGGGGGGVTTVGAFGSAPDSAGGSISGSTLTLQPADGTHPGGVTTGSQTFAGQKTFSTGLTGTLTGAASLNVLTSALGNLTAAGTDGIAITGGTGSIVGSTSIAQHVADATHNGYLTSTDWNTFNDKQASGTYIKADGSIGLSADWNAGAHTITATTFSGALTGTASGNVAYTANNHGVVVSGSGNTATVIAPDASASKVLKSGGASADPSWLAYTDANTVSTLVARDGSGNFAAGTITANLTGNASGTAASITGNLSGNVTSVGMVTTIPAGTITDAMINASAAIADTKLATIATTGKVSNTATTADSANTVSAIVTRDGSGNFSAGTISAALTGTASGNTTYSANQYGVVLSGSANAMTVLAPDASTSKILMSGGASANPSWVALSGDITVGNTGVTAIGSNKVTLAMMAQISTANFLGRTSGSTGNVESLTATQATALLDTVVGDSGSGGTKGLVPAPGSGDAAAGKFLKADGTFAVPAGGSVTEALVGAWSALGFF